MVSEEWGWDVFADARNPNVDRIHLLNRMTLELKEIQTLQSGSASIPQVCSSVVPTLHIQRHVCLLTAQLASRLPD